MSETDVTKQGVTGARPDREAVTGVHAGRRGLRRPRGEQPVVPSAGFTSYYGKPVINSPVWESPDIPGYLFLGGFAGAASLLGAGAALTGRPRLERPAKAGAFAGGCLSVAALVHDLGRPARFLNMMRVFKVTSPMSVGSWLLGGYVPAAGVAALSALTGRVPRIGAAATAGSAILGPAVVSYTAALISDTAVPAWHDAYPEMPFIFAGSGASAAGGLGMLAAPAGDAAPARNLALLGAAMEAAAFERMTHRTGLTGEPYSTGKGGAYIKAGKVLNLLGAAGVIAGQGSQIARRGSRGKWLRSGNGRRTRITGRGGRSPGGQSRAHRIAGALSGAAFLAASAATRWGIFHAGFASADDPKYTVLPQRERLRAG